MDGPPGAVLCHLLKRSANTPARCALPLPPLTEFATCARMPTAAPIAIDRLVKMYKTIPAVDGISFTLTAGSVTGLLGGNGAGKTTTIATIMGLTTPTSGRVVVLGAEMPRLLDRVYWPTVQMST